MRSEEIPAWCFLTGQFLIGFDRNKKSRTPNYISVHNDFLKSTETDPPLEDFYYVNPGIVIMLCYGLLVYSVEYWDSFLRDEINMKRLNKGIIAAAYQMGVSVSTFIELFRIIVWKGDTSESTFIRKLRNAIAHSHIDVDERHSEYTYRNVNRSQDVDFEITVSTENLGIFLTGLGRHFSGGQRRNR